MAESVVISLLKVLGQTLTPMVVNEVCLLKNVRENITQIEAEFRSMKALLRHADAKENMDTTVKVWVKEVRDVAFETEDVVDEYAFFLLFQPEQVLDATDRSCLPFIYTLQSIVHLLKNIMKWHQIVNQIQDIKTKVSEIARRKDNYGLIRLEQGSSSQTVAVQQHDPREDALFITEADIVGIDQSRADLVGWLVDKQNSALGFVSVYGEGGLGKTTLAKKVFDHKTVTTHFHFRVWVTVSQTFEIKALLKDLIKQLLTKEEKTAMKDELNDLNPTKLKQMVQDRLGGKRYIAILDDIWSLDAWRLVKNAFPDHTGHGSRIMVTTRSRDIAMECSFENDGHIFELPHLTLEDALQLFRKKALPSIGESNIPAHLKVISEKFIGKCHGLPLAIVSIAGLLRTKDPVEWYQIHENLRDLIKTNEKLKDINSIISLSYNDLPFHLKPCLLYLCIFPEDYSINCNRLLRLWAAEGFTETKRSSSMRKEDIGERYLGELISRSLVHAEELNLSGRVKTCRIHDIMREFILWKAREQDFVAHLVKEEDDTEGQMNGRRLSVVKSGVGSNLNHEVVFEKERFVSHLRSFFLFGEESFSMFSRFKLLKVLELNVEQKLGNFPMEITNLFNLRYLSVWDGTLTSLPSSIGKLTNMEILDMRFSPLVELPKEILRLKCLRYINIKGPLSCGVSLPLGIEKLSNLEKLSTIQANIKTSGYMVARLGMLTQMRSLRIKDLKWEDGMPLIGSLGMMKYLRSLTIISKDYGTKILHVDYPGWSPPPYLQKLRMDGALYTSPNWFPKLQNLIELHLSNSRLKDDSLLRVVQNLPYLTNLFLGGATDGEELCFETGGFPTLQNLTLSDFNDLRMVKVEQGAMPSILTLDFLRCEQLDKVPLGINHLTTLAAIAIWRMPNNFHKEMKKQVWKDGHTPLISLIN